MVVAPWLATTLLSTVSDGEGKEDGEGGYEGEVRAEKRKTKPRLQGLDILAPGQPARNANAATTACLSFAPVSSVALKRP